MPPVGAAAFEGAGGFAGVGARRLSLRRKRAEGRQHRQKNSAKKAPRECRLEMHTFVQGKGVRSVSNRQSVD